MEERKGKASKKKGERQKTYKELNMEQLEDWFGSKIESATIWSVFKGNDYDMNKTIADLTNLTGITPAPMREKPSSAESECELEEIKGDLFSCDPTDSLAHCISRDVRMGKGIAVLFRNKFGRVEDLKKQDRQIGEAAILKMNLRFVYYMITKEKYFNKPTYETLTTSLKYVRDHCVANGVKGLSMPKIGCGLDGLLWSNVKNIILEVFSKTGIRITVYYLE